MGVDNKNTIETKAPIIDIKDLGLTQGSGDYAKFETNKKDKLTNNTADEFKKVFENIQNKNDLKLKTITDALSKLTTGDRINLSAEILKSSDPKSATNEKVINDYKTAVKAYQDIIISLETASKDHFDWNKIGYHLTGKAGEIRESTVTLLSGKANDIYNNAKIINEHSQKIIELSTKVVEPVKIESQPAPIKTDKKKEEEKKEVTTENQKKKEIIPTAPTYLDITTDKKFSSLSKALKNPNITNEKGLVKKFTNNNKEIYIVPTSENNTSAIQVFKAKLNMKEVYVSASIDKNDPSNRLVLDANGVKLSDNVLTAEIDASKKLNETVSLKKKLETKDITTLDQAQEFIKNLTYMLDNTSEGAKIKKTIEDNGDYKNALAEISKELGSEKNINKSSRSTNMTTEQKDALQTIVSIINMNIKIPSSTPQSSNKSEVKKEEKKTEQNNSQLETIDTSKRNALFDTLLKNPTDKESLKSLKQIFGEEITTVTTLLSQNSKPLEQLKIITKSGSAWQIDKKYFALLSKESINKSKAGRGYLIQTIEMKNIFNMTTLYSNGQTNIYIETSNKSILYTGLDGKYVDVFGPHISGMQLLYPQNNLTIESIKPLLTASPEKINNVKINGQEVDAYKFPTDSNRFIRTNDGSSVILKGTTLHYYFYDGGKIKETILTQNKNKTYTTTYKIGNKEYTKTFTLKNKQFEVETK